MGEDSHDLCPRLVGGGGGGGIVIEVYRRLIVNDYCDLSLFLLF